jgi:carbonic anhydrase/acetyltransferase-like protein (isoleucine patch superfamily)
MAKHKGSVDKKYKLVRAGWKKANQPKWKSRRYFQLLALRDIPEHDVKAGDFGGYITKDVKLSHRGSCWIGGEAQVIGRVVVEDNAYIGGRVILSCQMDYSSIFVSGHARIVDDAQVVTYTNANRDPGISTYIKDYAEISGKAFCQTVAEISGTSRVYDKAVIFDNVQIQGASEVYGNAKIQKESAIIDTILQGNAIVGIGERLRNGEVDKTGIRGVVEIQAIADDATAFPAVITTPEEMIPVSPQEQESLSLFHEIKGNMASYETDIVKLIKYPAMVDKGIPETLAMTVALKKAERLFGRPESDEFREAVEALEQKFLVAESNAIKMAATILSEDQVKRTQKAKDLFRIASNDVSTEHEKKVAFVQGFKQLEGVIAVPESAYDTFRLKIGLKEIES